MPGLTLLFSKFLCAVSQREAVRGKGSPIWKGIGLVKMILISFTLDLIAITSEKKERIGLVFSRRILRTGNRVKQTSYQRTKCFGTSGI